MMDTKVHYRQFWGRTLCGLRKSAVPHLVTDEWKEVTCEKCLKSRPMRKNPTNSKMPSKRFGDRLYRLLGTTVSKATAGRQEYWWKSKGYHVVVEFEHGVYKLWGISPLQWDRQLPLKNPDSTAIMTKEEVIDSAIKKLVDTIGKPLPRPTNCQLKRWRKLRQIAGDPFNISEKEKRRLWKLGMIV